MKPCLKTTPQIVTSKCKFAPVSLPCIDPQTQSHGEMRLHWESRWMVPAVFTTSERCTHARTRTQLIPARPITVLTSDLLASSMPLVSILDLTFLQSFLQHSRFSFVENFWNLISIRIRFCQRTLLQGLVETEGSSHVSDRCLGSL